MGGGSGVLVGSFVGKIVTVGEALGVASGDIGLVVCDNFLVAEIETWGFRNPAEVAAGSSVEVQAEAPKKRIIPGSQMIHLFKFFRPLLPRMFLP